MPERRLVVNTNPKRDPSGRGNVSPKIANVAKDVVRDIKKSHTAEAGSEALTPGQTFVVRIQRENSNPPGRRDKTSVRRK